MSISNRPAVIAGIVVAFLMMLQVPGGAAVGIDIRIGSPPPYRIGAPPSVVVIPGTYVYVVPDIDVDVFFYSGHWYRPHEGRWFRARSCNGPWAYLPDPRVPRALVSLPPDYRRVPPGWHRIPHRDLGRHWSGWERDRHWDRDRDWREGWHGRGEERRDEGRGRFEDRRGGDRGRDSDRGERGRGR